MTVGVDAVTLEPLDGLTITTLADNYTDMLLVDPGPAKRAPIVVAWEHACLVVADERVRL